MSKKTQIPITPMMILYGDVLPWYVIIFGDACITSGAVWLLHNLEEMMERINSNKNLYLTIYNYSILSNSLNPF